MTSSSHLGNSNSKCQTSSSILMHMHYNQNPSLCRLYILCHTLYTRVQTPMHMCQSGRHSPTRKTMTIGMTSTPLMSHSLNSLLKTHHKLCSIGCIVGIAQLQALIHSSQPGSLHNRYWTICTNSTRKLCSYLQCPGKLNMMCCRLCICEWLAKDMCQMDMQQIVHRSQ